jgi:hypothetical protein
VARLIYRSNILGAINASPTRVAETLRRRSRKRSADGRSGGSALGEGFRRRPAHFDARKLFVTLPKKLLDLQSLYAGLPNRGAKTEAEDRMVGMYTHATFNLNRAHRRSTHHCIRLFPPNMSITCIPMPRFPSLLRGIRPGLRGRFTAMMSFILHGSVQGFELGLEMQRLCRENPRIQGIIMGQHGLINWADDDKECYERTLSLIERAANYIERKVRSKRR